MLINHSNSQLTKPKSTSTLDINTGHRANKQLVLGRFAKR